MSHKSRIFYSLITVCLLAVSLFPAAPVHAQSSQPPEDPAPVSAAADPIVLDSKFPDADAPIKSFAMDDKYIYLGGNFSLLGKKTNQRTFLDIETGALSANQVDPINEADINRDDVISDDAGGCYYLSGKSVIHLLADGTTDTAFSITRPGIVNKILLLGGHLYVWAMGETDYSPYTFVRANPSTGQVDESWIPKTFASWETVSRDNQYAYFRTYTSGIHGINKLKISSGEIVSDWNVSLTPKDLPFYDSYNQNVVSGNGRVFIAGDFTHVNGVERAGIAAVSEATGELVDWIVEPAGRIYRMVADGDDYIYVSGGVRNLSFVQRFSMDDGSSDGWNVTLSYGAASSFQIGSVDRISIIRRYLYIVGDFGSVNGDRRFGRVARFNLDDGMLDTTFQVYPDTETTRIYLVGDRLMISGGISMVGSPHLGLARIDRNTGVVDSDFAASLLSNFPTLTTLGLTDLTIVGDYLYAGSTNYYVSDEWLIYYPMRFHLPEGTLDLSWSLKGINRNNYYYDTTFAIAGDWMYFLILNNHNPHLRRFSLLDGQMDSWTPISDAPVSSFAISEPYLYMKPRTLYVLQRYRIDGNDPVLDRLWNTKFYNELLERGVVGDYIYFEENSYSQTKETGLRRLDKRTGNLDEEWIPGVGIDRPATFTPQWIYVYGKNFGDGAICILRVSTEVPAGSASYIDPNFSYRKGTVWSFIVDGAILYAGVDDKYSYTNPARNFLSKYIIVPPAPEALDADALTGTGFNARWNIVHGVTQYVVELTSEADNFAPNTFIAANGTRGQAQGVTVGGQNSSSLAFSGLDPNTRYVYRIRAVNAVGTSENSKPILQYPNLYNVTFALDASAALGEYPLGGEISAHLTSPGGIPTGTVTFRHDSNLLGTAQVDDSGTAWLHVNHLSLGENLIQVEYSGSAKFAPSVSPILRVWTIASAWIPLIKDEYE